MCFSCSIELHEKVIDAFIESIYSANWSHHRLPLVCKSAVSLLQPGIWHYPYLK
ncbi:hypothetical protein B9M40_004022 [Salmonella enterica subsp. enterica serovar Praha]|nr:hypothetical protein [Salmonella enterica]EBQ6116265.1 hypothetical protein [Salmonella enterica subsp. enterica serovar Praha]EAV4802845.1 hypothetical protein [Salmonella enterica]EBJ6122842.1 hypothetical protein [Salmonella enterica]EBO4026687.1 hypothetical protein [Salmonella enterica]